jgi:hypothetical protein
VKVAYVKVVSESNWFDVNPVTSQVGSN